MLLRKKPNPSLNFSTLATLSSLKWRDQIKQKRFVHEISSVLLQRKHWIPILRKFNLSPKVTPDLLLQILRKTQNHPQTSLDFFNWVKTNLRFEPDLKSHSKLTQILVRSNLLEPAKPLLDPFIRSVPASTVLDATISTCKGNNESRSLVLSFILEIYSNQGLIIKGLEIFMKIRVYECVPSTRSCNALLDALQIADQMRLAWRFYAVMIRTGIAPDSVTWSLVARLLCKEGKLEKVVRLLNSGDFSDFLMYNLIIDQYCRKGDFAIAIDLLNQMYAKNFAPGFSIYSSILDGACRYGDVEVIDSVMKEMVKRELLLTIPVFDYDSIIQKLCELGKTYAAEMFFKKVRDEEIGVPDDLYVCMLRALAKEGRIEDAMRVYRIIVERGIMVDASCCNVLVSEICKEEPSEQVNTVLKDVIAKGFVPSALDISRYITAQCSKGIWQEADELLNASLKTGLLPDSFCCCLLVEHYCADGHVELAIALHEKMVELGGSWDVASYNVLIDRLCSERRIGEAVRLFDYIREQNMGSSASYSTMITTLCCEKEMKKAMKIHDEMLMKGLKPDEATYKRLIRGFV